MKHCGACGKKFATAKELSIHLKICKCAIVGRMIIDEWNNEPTEEEMEREETISAIDDGRGVVQQDDETEDGK